MADARKTWAELDVLFATNSAGAINAQDLRDGFQSLEPHVAAAAPTASDDETLGFDVGHVWKNTSSTPDSFHKCMSASTGAAVWVQVYPASTAWGAITGTIGDQTDLAAVAGTGAADDVSYDNASSGLTASDVQAAIDELATAGGGGADEFADLTDTPANYTGAGGKYLRVNSTPDGLEFHQLVDGFTSMVACDQSTYDGLTPDENTIYFIEADAS